MTRRVILFTLLLVFLSGTVYALAAPSRLDARTVPGKNVVALSWGPVPGAAGYNVYRKEGTDPVYKKMNFSSVASQRYEDNTVAAGKDYLYVVRAAAADGTESTDSVSVGAPLMTINVDAAVTTMRKEPLSMRSIRTGKMVTFAAPGDIITYKISYANVGYSAAKNVKIEYDIPAGTIIAGIPAVKKGTGVQMAFFDKKKKTWSAKMVEEKNVGKVRFLVADVLRPVGNNKEVNGIIDLNVLITL
jgi:uncharacterized repeat protein (TIGR01451 family)